MPSKPATTKKQVDSGGGTDLSKTKAKQKDSVAETPSNPMERVEDTSAIEWKEGDPTGYMIYARGPQKKAISDVLRPGSVHWGCMETHPLGMSQCLVERGDFPSVGAKKMAEKAATFMVDERAHIEDLEGSATIQVWAERAKTGDKGDTVARWAGPAAVEEMARLFRKKLPGARLALELKWGKPTLIVQVSALEFCEAVDLAKANQLEHEVVTTPDMAVGFLEVMPKTKSLVGLGRAIHSARGVIERGEMDSGVARDWKVRWGNVDATKVGYHAVAYIEGTASVGDAWVSTSGNFEVRFTVGALDGTYQQMKAENEEIVKAALLIGKNKTTATQGAARSGGMDEGADTNSDVDSEDPQAVINGIETDIDKEMREKRRVAYAECAKRLTRSQAPKALRRAAIELVATQWPEELTHQESHLTWVKGITQPADVRRSFDEYHPDDETPDFIAKLEEFTNEMNQVPGRTPVRFLNPKAPKKKTANTKPATSYAQAARGGAS